MGSDDTPHRVRLDRWLWAARFYKTRSLAAAAIDGGKVQVNGTRVKRSSTVHVGDTIRVRKPPYETIVEIVELSEHRGPAKLAQTLYRETPESVAAREELRAQLKHQPHATYNGKGRPTKKDRRDIERFKRGR
ncbi:MAG: RNA-binding S4 domain-containing protein [Gemmatimonadales bacterium]|jgi:ribosome-associated heat shock protein Hsp15